MNRLQKVDSTVLEFKSEREFKEYIKLKKILQQPVKPGVAA